MPGKEKGDCGRKAIINFYTLMGRNKERTRDFPASGIFSRLRNPGSRIVDFPTSETFSDYLAGEYTCPRRRPPSSSDRFSIMTEGGFRRLVEHHQRGGWVNPAQELVLRLAGIIIEEE